MESEVRRDGWEPGAGSQATARREHEAAEAGGGSKSGQGSPAVGDPKKRLELVALKAAIEQVQQEYAFSERRACRLMTMAVTTYRYRSLRTDEPLRTKLVELAREKPRFGYRRLQVLLQRSGEQVNHKRLHRVYREAGLAIRRKKRKHCVREGKPLQARTSANQEWALDFVHDAVQCGRTIRVLSVVVRPHGSKEKSHSPSPVLSQGSYFGAPTPPKRFTLAIRLGLSVGGRPVPFRVVGSAFLHTVSAGVQRPK